MRLPTDECPGAKQPAQSVRVDLRDQVHERDAAFAHGALALEPAQVARLHDQVAAGD